MAEYSRADDWQLGRRRQQLIQELGVIEEELNRRRAQDRHIMRKDEIRWIERSEIGMRSEDRVAHLVNPILGFNVHNLESIIVERPPGSHHGAYHRHGEAIKYYLSGRGIEIIGDRRYEVEAGDVCFIPAFAWHGTENPGPEPVRYVAVVQASDSPLLQPVNFRIREDLREAPLAEA